MRRFTDLAIALLSLTLTALFAPWWGTVVIAVLLKFFANIRIRGIAFAGFFAWFIACWIRDMQNLFGPSRALSQLLKLDTIGLSRDSVISRLSVYSTVALVGLLLTFLTAQALDSAHASWRNRRNTV